MRSFLFLSLLAAGCSPFDPDLGGTPYKCGDVEPRCPEGYTCDMIGTTEVCVSPSGPGPDGPPSGFQCADDSNLEMGNGTTNDTISSAYATNVATIRKEITFAGLAICPEGDRDTYLVTTTTANQNFEVVVEWTSGSPVSVSILNAGGTSINNGVSTGAMTIRAYAANLPVGTYYAQVYAAANVKNNYKMTFKVDP